MINQRNVILTFFLILLIFFSGCTSENVSKNLTNPMTFESLSSTGQTINTTIKIPATPMSTIKTSQTPRTSMFTHLAQNETAKNRIDANTSYDLSIGNVSFRKRENKDNTSSYIALINITAKNNGPHPIELEVRGVGFSDNSGDGCAYTAPSWCGLVYFERINPGESRSMIANVIFSSKKDYDYLSSKKFEYDVEIGAEDMITRSSWDGNRNTWIIDMKTAI
jgi:hypothetical protein